MDAANQAEEWPYVHDDPEALREIERRLRSIARGECGLQTYAQLVNGIWFRYPSVDGGRPFEMDFGHDLHRAILGYLLGYLSAQSYAQHGFLLSALAISAEENRPSAPFFAWARTLGALTRQGRDAEDAFWFAQVRQAQAWGRGQGSR